MCIRDRYYEIDPADVIETEIKVPTQEELIAEKEAELLKMYAELQALKTN
jgi:hypothetical protein